MQIISKPQVRYMRLKEQQLVQQWCVQEQWNICVQDGIYLYECDPQGHFLMALNETLIASISIVNHGANFYTLGPFLVDKKFRNQGFGQLIWKEALASKLASKKKYCILLCAVQAQVSRYMKSGFTPFYVNQYWYFPQICQPRATIANQVDMVSTHDINQIIEYDEAVYFASRACFLERIINNPLNKTLVYRKEGKVQGYAMLRPYQRGCRIGPVVADNEDIAEWLYTQLLQYGKGEFLFTEILENNPSATKLMKRLGAINEPAKDTVTMLNQTRDMGLLADVNRYYSILSLETG